MFAQLANTILHGVRIFDEAAKNTTPPRGIAPMIATRHGADIIAVRTPTRKETTMTFDDEPGKDGLADSYIGSAGNGHDDLRNGDAAISEELRR